MEVFWVGTEDGSVLGADPVDGTVEDDLAVWGYLVVFWQDTFRDICQGISQGILPLVSADQ